MIARALLWGTPAGVLGPHSVPTLSGGSGRSHGLGAQASVLPGPQHTHTLRGASHNPEVIPPALLTNQLHTGLS